MYIDILLLSDITSSTDIIRHLRAGTRRASCSVAENLITPSFPLITFWQRSHPCGRIMICITTRATKITQRTGACRCVCAVPPFVAIKKGRDHKLRYKKTKNIKTKMTIHGRSALLVLISLDRVLQQTPTS